MVIVSTVEIYWDAEDDGGVPISVRTAAIKDPARRYALIAAIARGSVIEVDGRVASYVPNAVAGQIQSLIDSALMDGYEL